MKIVLTLLAATTLLASECACADTEPTIVARTPSTLSYRHAANDHELHLDSTYGDEITIFCTAANATNLAIVNLNGLLKSVSHNSTTIQVSIEQLDVGEHTYHCMDSSTGFNKSLVVTVRPAVAVTSPNVRQASGNYYVPRDEIYDVFCSAHDVEALSLKYTWSKALDPYLKLHTEAVNGTTVSATLTNNLEVRRYKCLKAEISTVFDVIVDYGFEVQIRDFQCILHLFHKLECTWTSSNTKNAFTLFTEGKLLCTDMSGAAASGCVHAWDKVLDDAYAFSLTTHLPLQLEVCNEAHCKNLTFSIEIRSIMKLEPVRNVKVTITDPQNELMRFQNNIYEIEWLHRNFLCYRGCEYKFEYTLEGMHWRQAEVTDLAGYEFSGGVVNYFKLPLPCPNTLYEFRIYVRPKTVKDDRLWSEPAYVEYATHPRDMSPADLSCAKFWKQEPTSTPAVE